MVRDKSKDTYTIAAEQIKSGTGRVQKFNKSRVSMREWVVVIVAARAADADDQVRVVGSTVEMQQRGEGQQQL